MVPPLRSNGGRWDELAWKRRLFGDEPEADNDNAEADQQGPSHRLHRPPRAG
jgi:hypothetical protein